MVRKRDDAKSCLPRTLSFYQRLVITELSFGDGAGADGLDLVREIRAVSPKS